MPDEKKKKGNPLFDLGAPFEGLSNVVSGKVFDPKSWDYNAEVGTEKKTDGDGADEVTEETVTTTTRRRGKRGTFTTAPTKKPDPGKPEGGGDGGKAPEGTATGEQDGKK